MSKWPIVERWESHPLDLKDCERRFCRSDWNYFLVSQDDGVLVGYWEAEEGQENLGGDDFHEVLHVIDGRIDVTCKGEKYVAEPGDTVIVQRGRPMQIVVHEFTRVFFICFSMQDPIAYDAMVRRMMLKKGL